MDTGTVPLFLYSQPSIKELHFGSESIRGEADIGGFLSRFPSSLPNLTSITAPISALVGAVPGRPISQIMIVTEMTEWTDQILAIAVSTTWKRILCSSTVPITTIGFYQAPRSYDLWDQLIPALKRFDVNKTLESIRIVETLEAPVTEERKQEALSRRVNQMKTITGFDRLENIEFSEMPNITSPTADVLRWLGSMGSLDAWREYVPSLKQVKMYGVYAL